MAFKKQEDSYIKKQGRFDFAISSTISAAIEALYYTTSGEKIDPKKVAEIVDKNRATIYENLFMDGKPKKKDSDSKESALPNHDGDLNKVDLSDPEQVKTYMEAIYDPAPKTIVVPISKIRRAHISGERFSSKDVLDEQRKGMRFVQFEGDTAQQLVREAQVFDDEWGDFEDMPKEEVTVSKEKIKKGLDFD